MHTKSVCLFLPLCLLAACGTPDAHYGESAEPAPAAEAVLATADSVAFGNSIFSLTSPSRKMIRTADLHCRVDDVFAASTQLESLVKASGGIVEESKMTNQSTGSRNIYHTADSIKKVEVYTSTAHLVLRVPVAALDTVLKTIPAISTFVESRTLAQEDVTLRYLNNSLKNEVRTDTRDPMALAKKSGEAIEAAEYLAGTNERSIDRRIENLQLLDEVNYTTITVDLHQPERVNTAVVINADRLTEIAYGIQLMLAFSKGWQAIKGLFVVMITLWPLWIVAVTALLAYRRFRRPAMAR
ncbi:MAG TPA: DUF4349 domain-containing protein [Flavipsychrobacter sp.]|nr:DUF4349 domain-containing protein [Flavipsychrobacter sp.]